MESEKDKYQQQDEINLYDIIVIIKRKAKIIISIFLISIFSAWIISYMMTPVYRGNFIIKLASISSNSTQEIRPIISPTDTINQINKLGELCKEKNYHELSEILSIENNKSNKIKSIKSKSQSKDNDSVEITTDVTDPQLVDEIKLGIVNYLNLNKYVNDRIITKKENLLSLREDMEGKIGELEELRDIVTNNIRSNKIKNIGFNPLWMNTDLINLKQRLKEIESEIKLIHGFEVTVEPVIPVKPIRPKIVLNIVVVGLIVLLLSILLSVIVGWLERSQQSSG